MPLSTRAHWLAGLLALTTALAAPLVTASPASAETAPPTNVPAACSAGTPVMSEDFTDGAIPDGWTVRAGKWSITDGALTGTGPSSAANPTRIITDAPHLDRYCLDLTMRFTTAASATRWAGAILDIDPTTTGGPWQHAMMRTNGTVAFGTRTPTNTGWGTDTLGTTQTPIPLNQTIHLTIRVDGTHGEIHYSPNTTDTPTRIATTDTLQRTPTGTIGLLLDGTTTHYDNITLTQLPEPAACSAGTPVMSEDFTDGAIPDGWTVRAGKWSITDGALTGTGPSSAANPTRIITDAPHLDRYCLDLTMRFTTAASATRWAGAILDIDPTTTGGPWQHAMMRTNGTVAFGTRTPTNTGWGTDTLGTTQTPIPLNQTIHLTIRVDGTHGEIHYSPNTTDTPTRIATTDTLQRTPTGTIGLLLDGTTTHYDNITLTQLPESTPIALTIAGAPDRTAVTDAPIAAWKPSALGGAPAYAWSATGLPEGLAMNAKTGSVTGTPTTAGTSTVTIVATDAEGATAVATFIYTVTALVCFPSDRVPAAGDTGAVVAHRGNDGDDGFGDNTIAGIANAVANGADAFEIDIFLTNDGVPVVRHDAIGDISLAQFRARYPDLPTLEEVASWMQTSDATMLLEYKASWTVDGARIVTDVLHAHGVESRTVTQAFSQSVLDAVHTVDPEMPLMLLVSGGVTLDQIRTAQSRNLVGINPSTTPSAATVRAAHDAGVKVFVWTKNNAAEWATATVAGVDGIITDNTSALVNWYAAYNASIGLKSCRP
ncbi:glycerophosphodiester phosphodiesterase family protein [Leifsonia aquatica]|uniref:glycerophosphodiester phosphodiesterase family protein n=1 Tax=Leifsonia aquatica TaxID=144185 RepID=UPI0037FBED7D